MKFDKQKTLEEARAYARRGKVRQALARYREVVAAEPGDSHSWLQIGELCERSRAPAMAVDAFTEAARGYRRRGFAARAIAAYEHGLRIAPDQVSLHLELGAVYVEARQRVEGMRRFLKAAELQRLTGNEVAVVDAMRRAVDAAPDDAAVRMQFAVDLAVAGRLDEAAAEFELLCGELRRQARIQELITAGVRWLELQPDNFDLRLELAALLLDRDLPQRSLALLKVCYQRDPHDLRLLGILARVLGALGRRDHAVAVLRTRARLLVAADRTVEACEAYRVVLALVPGDPEASAALSSEDGARRRLAVGTTMRQAPGNESSAVHRLFEEARAYAKAGQKARAIERLQKLLQHDPQCEAAVRALTYLRRDPH